MTGWTKFQISADSAGAGTEHAHFPVRPGSVIKSLSWYVESFPAAGAYQRFMIFDSGTLSAYPQNQAEARLVLYHEWSQCMTAVGSFSVPGARIVDLPIGGNSITLLYYHSGACNAMSFTVWVEQPAKVEKETLIKTLSI